MISNKMMCAWLVMALLLLLGPGNAFARQPGPLTLAEALERALAGNPELEAAELAGRSGRALAEQAGVRPNPELDVEWENLAGSGELQGMGSSELTVSVSQLLETGGKRFWRRELAEGEAVLQGWEHRVVQQDLRLRVQETFIQAWLAQECLDLAREHKALAEELVTELESRVSAGASSAIEANRAKVGVARAEIEIRQAERCWRAMARQLAACWGSLDPDFTAVFLDVDALSLTAEQPAGDQWLADNSEVARWRLAGLVEEARQSLARAEGKPDLNLSLGVKNDFDLDDRAFVVGAGLPLPLFDSNKGAIRAAGHEVERNRLLAENAAIEVRTAFAQAAEERAAAGEEIQILSSQIIPLATEAQQDTQRGHQLGLFSLTDVLETRQSLFELRREYLEAVARFKIAQARIERLRGDAPAAESTPSRRSGHELEAVIPANDQVGAGDSGRPGGPDFRGRRPA